MERMRKSETRKYGEAKKKFQFMLTETVSQEIDRVADTLGVSRSEAVEVVFRSGLDSEREMLTA